MFHNSRTWVRAGVLIVAAATSSYAVSLTAASAVRMALEHNESLRMASVDAFSSRQRVREVRADGFPAVEATVDFTRNWLLPSFVFNGRSVKIGSDNEIVGALRVSHPLYTGGRVGGALESARYGVDLSDERERQVRQEVTARAEVAIYDYLLAQEMVRVSRLALVRARSNRRQVEALREAGRASRFELMRARVEVASAESDSIRLLNQQSLAAIGLKDAIGLSLDTPVEVIATFRDSTRLELGDVDALVATALQRRPERRQLDARQKARQGQLRVANSARRPTVDLVALGQMQFLDDTFDGLGRYDDWRRSWSTGVVLRVPVFDGMRSRAQVAQERQALQRLDLEREQVERGIEAQVRRAWMNLNEASQRLRAREGSVGQAEKGLADAESRYAAGRGTQLEVLDAHLTLLTAQSEHARGRRDRSAALVELERAVGVLGED